MCARDGHDGNFSSIQDSRDHDASCTFSFSFSGDEAASRRAAGYKKDENRKKPDINIYT